MLLADFGRGGGGVLGALCGDERAFAVEDLGLAGGELGLGVVDQEQVALGPDREELVDDVRMRELERRGRRLVAGRVGTGESDLNS